MAAICHVPGCVTASHAGGMCGRHYMEAYEGRPFTIPCPGDTLGVPCLVGGMHPLAELLTPMWDDPPVPEGLGDAIAPLVPRLALLLAELHFAA